MARRALVLVALLLLPAVLVTPAASACFSAVGVPCGRIYPLILMQVEDQLPSYPLSSATPLTVEALLTYKFDMTENGYTVVPPTEQITIGFEFPRKPDWVEISVEPERLAVDVNDPRYVQPDTSNPTTPQASYVFTAPITITVQLTGQPVLKDGYDYQKLLVFAKSTESGLYQAGYGIKEVRVAPVNALHESDVAGTRDVFTTTALPALTLAPVSTAFGGTTVSLEPPADAVYWEPTPLTIRVDPAPAGRMVFAVHDEAGALVAHTPPLDASVGAATLNATFVRPGLHTATLTLLPTAGTSAPPMTYALPFETGVRDAEGWDFPKAYVVTTSETIPAPLASRADPLAQFERDIPFFAFDTAQSASASLTLKTPAAPDLGRALSNLQFSIVAPDAKELAIGSVDPTKPVWSIRVGTVPEEGWYALRVKGLGAPIAAGFDARIEVNYAAQHKARNRADGLADATTDVLGLGGRNVTLPASALGVWAPGDLTPVIDGADTMRYQLTVVDANATPVYASGARMGPATFSAPAPGWYRAFVFAEPEPSGVPYSPIVRAFAFSVGAETVTVADKFVIEDAWEAPGMVEAGETLLGFHVVDVLPSESLSSGGSVSGGQLRFVDEEGADASGFTLGPIATAPLAPGRYWALVSTTPPPAMTTESVGVQFDVEYSAAQTLTGPSASVAPASTGFPVPGLAVGAILVVAGLAAVGVALLRRR